MFFQLASLFGVDVMEDAGLIVAALVIVQLFAKRFELIRTGNLFELFSDVFGSDIERFSPMFYGLLPCLRKRCPLINVEFGGSASFVYEEIAGFLCSTFPTSDAKRDALEANTATGEGCGMVFPNEIQILKCCGAGHVTGLIVLGPGLLILVPEFLSNSVVRPLKREILLIAFASDGGNNSPTVEARGQLPFFIKANSHG